MNKCKNCGANLTKFQKDLCPYCGCKNPIDNFKDGTNTTQAIDQIEEFDKDFKIKSFKIYILLLSFLGIFGIDQFYISKIRDGLARLMINLCFFLILFLGIYLSNKELLLLSILLPLGILFLIYFIYGIVLFIIKKHPKDKNGVFLK